MRTDSSRLRLALVTNDLLSAYQVSLCRELDKLACQENFDLVVAIGKSLDTSDPNVLAHNAIFDWLSNESVDGLIVLGAVLFGDGKGKRAQEFFERMRGVPWVCLGVNVGAVPSVVVDNRLGMRLATEHLIRTHGCRKFLFIGGPPESEEALARFEGFQQALARYDIGFEVSRVAHGQYTLPTGQVAMRELLERELDFDAVVAANDYMALGALDALHEAGVVVPEQAKVVGFDDSDPAQFCRHPLTSVAQPAPGMVRAALRALLQRVRGDSVQQLSCLSPLLSVRDSCGCAINRGEPARRRVARPPDALEVLEEQHDALVEELIGIAPWVGEWWEAKANRLLTALRRELRGEAGVFLRLVESLERRGPARGVTLDVLRRSLFAVRRVLSDAGCRLKGSRLQALWLRAHWSIAHASNCEQGRTTVDISNQFSTLSVVVRRLASVDDHESFAVALEYAFRELGIYTGCVVLAHPEEPGLFRPLLVLRGGRRVETDAVYPRDQLLPGALRCRVRCTLHAMALTVSAEVTGLMAIEARLHPAVVEMLQSQISCTTKMVALRRDWEHHSEVRVG